MRVSSRLVPVLGVAAACVLGGCAAQSEQSSDDAQSAIRDGRTRLHVTDDYVQLGDRRVDRKELAQWSLRTDDRGSYLVHENGRVVRFSQRDLGDGNTTLDVVGSDFSRRVTWTDERIGSQLSNHGWGKGDARPGGVQPKVWFIVIAVIVVVVVLATPGEVNPPPRPEDPDLIDSVPVMKKELQQIQIAID